MRAASLMSVCLDLLPAVLLCALFVGVGVVHVTSRVLVMRQGYQLSKLEQSRTELSLECDHLKLELATLKSSARLQRLAKEQLGMGPPPASAIIEVESKTALRPGKSQGQLAARPTVTSSSER